MTPKILHVDDSEDIRDITMLALETIGGLEILQCGSGAEALSKALSFQPDLFLLDVMMPEMTGPETLRRLRELPPFVNTPAIFLTAKAQIEDIEYLKGLGAIEVITKPFDPMTIAAKIVEIWELARGKTQ